MARLFVGNTSNKISVPINLSIYASLTLSFWMWWDTFANNDRLAFEFGGSNYLGNGFIVDPNATNGSTSRFNFGIGVGAPSWVDEFARPSAATWHHYMLTMNRATPVNLAYVDGVAQTMFTTVHNAGTYGNFSNSTLQLMSRNSVSLFGAGRLADVSLYPGVLFGQGEASELAKGVSPLRVRPDRLLAYLTLDGAAANSDPIYGRMGGLSPALATLTGTTGAAHPFGQRTPVSSRRKNLVRS